MTTNMRNAIEQAALEVGRAIAKYEMLTAPTSLDTLKAGMIVTGLDGRPHTIVTNVRKPRELSVTKSAKAPRAAKAPTVARGVKKAAAPRAKGVKERIMSLIASEPMTVDRIIEHTGFKATSVRATLMGLKKAGIATALSDKKSWAPYDVPAAGNSEEHASA